MCVEQVVQGGGVEVKDITKDRPRTIEQEVGHISSQGKAYSEESHAERRVHCSTSIAIEAIQDERQGREVSEDAISSFW